MTFHIIEGTHWWALNTRSNFEKPVNEQLAARQIEAFLPTYRAFSRRKDRRVINTLPLFPGYVFVFTNLSDFATRLQVLQTRGIVRIVGNSKGPVPVKTSEIESIRTLCQSERMLEPWSRIEVGKPVRIVSGGLTGVTGVVVDVKGKGKRIICNVELLGRAVATELQADELEPAL